MPTDEGDSDDDSDFAVSETASETDEEEIIELSCILMYLDVYERVTSRYMRNTCKIHVRYIGYVS